MVTAIDTGRRYNEQQRAAVFDVWAFKADRSAVRTVKLLPDDAVAAELIVTVPTEKTIRGWAVDEGWETRANQALYAGAPGRRFRTQTALVLSAPEAAEFLRKLVNLDESLMTDVTWVDKSGEVQSMRTFDEKVLKLRMQSAQLILDRTGFSPVGQRDLNSIDAPPEIQTDILKEIAGEVDPAKLERIAAAIRREQGIGG